MGHSSDMATDDRKARRYYGLSPAGWAYGGDWVFGSTTVKVDPWPGREATSIVPPWAPTTLFANARPSPVPCSFGFVVKNGWKSFWTTSGDIPGPVSWTITATVSPRSSIPTVTAPDEVA